MVVRRAWRSLVLGGVPLRDGPGKGYEPWIRCRENADYHKIMEFAEERMSNPERFPAYSWNPLNPNTCVTFANDAIQAGLR